MKILPLIAAVSTLAMTATANESFTLRYVTFVPAGAYGDDLNPNVDGMAMVRYNAGAGWTRVQLMMSGLEANTTYGVQVGEEFWQPNAFFTNSNGRGNFVGEFAHPPATDSAILIFVPGPQTEEFGITFEELRAVSSPM